LLTACYRDGVAGVRIIPLFWKCLGITIAGGLGSLARFGLTELVEHFVGKVFPFGTLLVNLLGCLAFGILWTLCTKGQLNDEWRLILLVGFLGGFTTFSSFAFHNQQMLTQAQWGSLLLNVLIQNIVGIAAVWLGIKLAS
jgi:fluoride exporter